MGQSNLKVQIKKKNTWDISLRLLRDCNSGHSRFRYSISTIPPSNRSLPLHFPSSLFRIRDSLTIHRDSGRFWFRRRFRSRKRSSVGDSVQRSSESSSPRGESWFVDLFFLFIKENLKKKKFRTFVKFADVHAYMLNDMNALTDGLRRKGR